MQTMLLSFSHIFPLRMETKGYTGPENITERLFDKSDLTNQIIRVILI